MNPPDASSRKDPNEALTAALASIGSPLDAAACKKNPNRTAHVRVWHQDFTVNFWSRGVWMADGICPDLREVASAVDLWIRSPELRTSRLCSLFTWIKPMAGASAFDEGREVDWKWEQLLHDFEKPPAVHALIRRAALEPGLRQLFPYTSLDILCFSRCTGYPFTRDTPAIAPAPFEGEYLVLTMDRRELGRGDADTAVKIAVAHLPPSCGPARPGTANEEEP